MGLIKDAWRLLKIAKKPSREEVWLVVRVTGLGVSFMGILGFLITLTFQVMFESLFNMNY